MPGPGDVVDLLVDKAAAGGRMLARLDGQVTLVAGAIPGERVRARLEGRRGGVLFATVTEVLEPSPDRRAPGDDPACGGRHFAHIVPARQQLLKAEILRDAFRRIARRDLPSTLPAHGSPEDGYRMRARLHVQGASLGFYREGTHALCDPACSRQLRADTLSVLAEISSALATSAVTTGRALELAENRAATERAVFLELASVCRREQLSALLNVTGVSGIGVAGAGTPIVAQGSPVLTEELALFESAGAQRTLRLQHHVRGFFQGNRFLLQTLVERVLAHVPEGPIADLYAGVGVFGLAHAALERGDVLAVEGDPTAAEDLHANAAAYPDAVRVVDQPVEAALDRRAALGGRTVIVDPPRTGLSRAVVAALSEIRPSHLVYISCDVATLARDVAALDAGGYEITGAEIFDLFPGTAHVETLISLKSTG